MPPGALGKFLLPLTRASVGTPSPFPSSALGGGSQHGEHFRLEIFEGCTYWASAWSSRKTVPSFRVGAGPRTVSRHQGVRRS